MRAIFAILSISLFTIPVFGQTPATPAEERIAFVTKEIGKTPSKSNLYNELAIGLIRRERETSNKALFDQAQVALDKSLQLAPANLEAQKVETALLLGKHEFASALSLAEAVNKKVPDDVMTYGYIADAEIALGDYADAEKAAQWMLDLRTHNVPGLLRGAELRQVFGDSEGALQFLSDSYQQASPDQTEEIAWALTRMAEINLAMGKLDLAQGLLQRALASFPDYYRSLEVQARLRAAQHKYAEAADLLHLRNQHFAQPESIYAEAVALEHSGNMARAKELYVSFERTAESESDRPDNDNRDLVFYYLNNHDSAEALRFARLAISLRHDIWTIDSYATALYANGGYLEARTQIEKALAPSIRDADIFFHAAQINAALKNQPAAVRYLKSSLEANPESSVADDARQMLAKLSVPEYGARSK
jgi:tetratricopeptide (TPR) repeat protein